MEYNKEQAEKMAEEDELKYFRNPETRSEACWKKGFGYVGDTLDDIGEIVPVFMCEDCKNRTIWPNTHKKNCPRWAHIKEKQ